MNDRSRTLVALSVYHCVNDGSLTLLASALPVMRVALGLDFVQIGTILGAGLLATMLLQLLFGSLSDLGHASLILIVGFFGIVSTDLVFTISTTFTQVLIFYVLLRCAAAVYHPVGFSSIGRIYVRDQTRAFGLQGAVGDLGLTFATFSTGVLSEMWGWKVPFWIWGGIGVILLVCFLAMVSRHRLDFYAQRSASTVQADEEQGLVGPVRSAFAILALVSSIITGSFIIFTGYMPLYFNIIEGLSPAWGNTIVAAWIGIGVLAGALTGRIVGMFGGEARTLRIMFLVETALFAIAVVSLHGILPYLAGSLIRFVTLALTGIPMFVAFPAVNGLLGMKMPRRRLGLMYAANLSLGLLVGAACTYLVGYLAAIGTISVVLPVLLAITILGILASLKT